MKRILFVDDEVSVLTGLRNSLRSRRAEWDCTFISDPQAALTALEKGSFDVIVSDMRTMDEQLNQSKNHVYFIGVQKDPSEDAPRTLSRSGKELSTDLSHLPQTFEKMARQVSAAAPRYSLT